MGRVRGGRGNERLVRWVTADEGWKWNRQVRCQIAVE